MFIINPSVLCSSSTPQYDTHHQPLSIMFIINPSVLCSSNPQCYVHHQPLSMILIINPSVLCSCGVRPVVGVVASGSILESIMTGGYFGGWGFEDRYVSCLPAAPPSQRKRERKKEKALGAASVSGPERQTARSFIYEEL